MTEQRKRDRIIKLPAGRRIYYDRLSDEDRAVVDVEIIAFADAVERNPIAGFDCHSPSQLEFLAARTSIVAAFAGNQFGKSTALAIRALIQCLDERDIPEHLKPHKIFDAPCHGWLMVPTEDKLYDSIKPAIEKWVGPHLLKGGSWGKAFNGERMQLTFTSGSTITFKTYKQHESTLGGATLQWVAYDEPPPRPHREEAMTRLMSDERCFEMFAMTPLNTNTGWIKREIFKKREDPDITVVRGSMHDNTALSKKAVARTLGRYHNDLWRRAREFGDFVDVGGQIYEGVERAVCDTPAPQDLIGRDFVVGIDPGIRNTGIIFSAFDNENVGTVFDELLLQNATVEDVAAAIFKVLAKWGIPKTGHRAPLYVIDPSVPRSQTARDREGNAQTLQTALALLGIGAAKANNDVNFGIQQIRGRLQHSRLWIARSCVGLRDEADEYAAEDRPDGEFKVIKENDHRVDAWRYAFAARPWFPETELDATQRNLGATGHRWQPGQAIPAKYLTVASECPPLGAMS